MDTKKICKLENIGFASDAISFRIIHILLCWFTYPLSLQDQLVQKES